MSTHQIHPQKDAIYFITFTCHHWLDLFDKTQCYDAFDKWFEYLNSKSITLLGYVIMPNHFHGLLHISAKSDKTLNQVVANGKRFLAYEIVKRLKENNALAILNKLQGAVSPMELKKGKKHQVFRPSFDAKLCYNINMVEVKLGYIHANPVKGKWNLVNEYTDYPYSSAAFYEKGNPVNFVKHYKDFI